MRKLGSMLVDNSFRISTGLGLGVGNALFTGALEQVYRSPDSQFDECLLIRPFPQFVADKDEREKLWDSYRSDFIPSAGLALFLFGNKQDGQSIVDASGMISEFEIAAENGLVLLPIGATGSVAKKLAERLIANPGEYSSVPEHLFHALGELVEPVDNLNELLQPILKLVRAAN